MVDLGEPLPIVQLNLIIANVENTRSRSPNE